MRGIGLLRQAAEREALTEKAPVTPGPLAPARERLAEALLEAGDAAALAEFERVQQPEPDRFRAVSGAARAAEQAGGVEAVRLHYARLLEVATAADTPRPELEAARRYLGRG